MGKVAATRNPLTRNGFGCSSSCSYSIITEFWRLLLTRTGPLDKLIFSRSCCGACIRSEDQSSQERFSDLVPGSYTECRYSGLPECTALNLSWSNSCSDTLKIPAQSTRRFSAIQSNACETTWSVLLA